MYSELIGYFELVLMSAMSGLLLVAALSISGQKWVRTYHHTMTYILLPTAALVITSVIAGNIALSLGMIGALSIVRFRNPVKNSFELVMFFILLTIGISIGVNIKWAIILVVITIMTIFSANILNSALKKISIQLFSVSFGEGSVGNVTIEVESSTDISEILEEYGSLHQVRLNGEQKNYHYIIIASKVKSVSKMLQSLKEIKGVSSVVYES
jgi:hypothetical protein